MDVVVAGGHGQIGLRLLALLAARGDRARGLIRDPDHAEDLRSAGAEPVVADLERDDLFAAVGSADAIVFAAGAGPGSGIARKWTLDFGGAARLVEVAKVNGIERYVIVSSMGAGDPGRSEDETFRAYLEAKGAADAAVLASGLAATVLRPGSLTNEVGTGRVELARDLGRFGPVERDDVAATLLALLDEPGTAGLTLELLGGGTPIAEAVRAAAAG
jgi:uncharacterized protein YbjT (DUF2867 family)